MLQSGVETAFSGALIKSMLWRMRPEIWFICRSLSGGSRKLILKLSKDAMVKALDRASRRYGCGKDADQSGCLDRRRGGTYTQIFGIPLVAEVQRRNGVSRWHGTHNKDDRLFDGDVCVHPTSFWQSGFDIAVNLGELRFMTRSSTEDQV